VRDDDEQGCLYLTLFFIVIRYIHLVSSVCQGIDRTYAYNNTHSTPEPKNHLTSKHSPFHIPDNVHMIRFTMRVEEDILPLRPP
jgi:hypothetical protein